MVAVGLVLLVLSVLVAAGMVLSNGESIQAEALGVSLEGISVGGLFLVGMAVGVVAMLGLGLMLLGAARRRAKRVAVKREVSSVRGERENLAEENARLQAELERNAASPPPTVAPATPAVGDSSAPRSNDADVDAPGRHRA
ncbi:MAG: hypothetical protein KY451_14215 [Actinobacteria bacterium]|nr:hypothetical protein [Actinomycetota bacterium]MBW3648592.1 hypothetical protein [Actinomycetota bacterium]